MWTHYSPSLLIKGLRPPNGNSGWQAQNRSEIFLKWEQDLLLSLWHWVFNLLEQFPGIKQIYSAVNTSSECCSWGFVSLALELCKRNPFKWWSRYMQPGRLKWPLWSILIGKIGATSQQNTVVEIPDKVKYSSCSSGHTGSPCVWCFQVVIGVLKLLW